MIVQMSYGDTIFSQITARLMERLYLRGDMLLVASAGNDQADSPSEVLYPAGYTSVISVGAVDCNGRVPAFSQRNAKVELAAPGAAVLSTVIPSKPDVVKLSAKSAKGKTATFTASPVELAGKGRVLGQVVDCGLGKLPCPFAAGKICLVARGETAFGCKHNNALLAGCTAMLLTNNEMPACKPLENPVLANELCPLLGGAYLPMATLSLADGTRLQTMMQQGKTNVTLTITRGLKTVAYAKYDGTSMSAPYVSGVAARIWADFPACTNAQVRQALTSSAKDMGEPGRDEEYGFGLVSAPAAYQALKAMGCGAPPPAVPAPMEPVPPTEPVPPAEPVPPVVPTPVEPTPAR